MIDIFCAFALDLLLGDPAWMPHPIRLMGHVIAFEEQLLRTYAKGRHALMAGGGLIVLLNISAAFGIPYLVLLWARPFPLLFHGLHIYLLYTCLAARCLRDEALKVSQGLQEGIAAARNRLSFIVGRDTTHLDEPDIIRAAVETVAENTADGVIAPLFYAILGGAPAALAYKMINTMDSMLGYTNNKYRHLGFFPAKTDDLANFLPARLTGICMIIGSLFRFHVRRGLRIMIRDRHNHKSPNCAYPEGAVAGLLGIRLGGDNVYFGKIVEKPTIGDYTRPLTERDIRKTIEIMFRAEFCCLLGYVLWTILFA